jgi:glycerol uptake facilitator protein
MQNYLAEFVGTLLLILLGDGVVANVVLERTKGHGSGWIVIAFGWAMAVYVAVWCVGPISGAHINPAVTLALAAAGDFEWTQVPGYMIAQFVGAFVGAVLVYIVYRDHFAVTNSADAKLGTFATGPAIRNSLSNFVSEVVGTAVLVLAVLFATSPGEPIDAAMKPGLATLGALRVGFVVLAIGLCLGGTTGYAINPARDLGPRIAHFLLPIPGKRDSDWGYSWIPVAGPLVGALLAVAVWRGLLLIS